MTVVDICDEPTNEVGKYGDSEVQRERVARNLGALNAACLLAAASKLIRLIGRDDMASIFSYEGLCKGVKEYEQKRRLYEAQRELRWQYHNGRMNGYAEALGACKLMVDGSAEQIKAAIRELILAAIKEYQEFDASFLPPR